MEIRKVDENSAYAPRGPGFIERFAGNHQKALALYEEAILLAPDDATLIGLHGIAKSGLTKYEDAVKNFNPALDPPSSMHVDEVNIDGFQQMRGISFVELRACDSAIRDLDYWLDKNPNEPCGLLYRGIALVEQGREIRMKPRVSPLTGPGSASRTVSWR